MRATAVSFKTDRTATVGYAAKMSDVPPPPALSKSVSAPVEITLPLLPPSFAPIARANSAGVDHAYEFAATPTCPPPVTPPPINCCAQFRNMFPEPPPSPPRLRRTDTASNYAVMSSQTTDPMYDRWLLEDNFARLSAIEDKLRKQFLELDMVRSSMREINRRLNGAPAAPSSPVTRQVAAPHTAPHTAPDITRDFGM